MKRCAVILLMLFAGLIPAALARPTYLANAEATYPGIVGTRIDSCTLCHNDPFDGTRNPYGIDFFNAGLNFASVELTDSDGDGVSNKNEIDALFFPGDATDTPPSSPPADTTPPVLTIIGSNPIHVAQGSAYTDAGATALDNVDGDLTSAITVTGSVDTSTPGSYLIHYRVQDAAANVAEAARTVIVDAPGADTTPPVLTLLGVNPTHVAQGSVYTDAGATALDDVDGDLTSAITVTGAVDTSTPGSYPIHYRVQDAASNVAEATRTVIVDSPNPPPPTTASELQAQLVAVGDDATASGHARFEIDSQDGESQDSENHDGGDNGGDKSATPESKFLVEVRNVYSTSTVDIRLNGEIIGTAHVEEGKARFSLESEHGDTVPAVQDGDLIEVLRDEDKAVLLSGNFAAPDQSEEHDSRPAADVNQDGVFSFADIREVALSALGQIQSIYDVDLDHNGTVDVADVQLVLNAGCGFVEHYFSQEIGRNSRLEARLEAVSDDKSTLHGKANYSVNGSRRSLHLELEGPLGVSQIAVTVDGQSLGTIDVTGDSVEAEWDTEHGDTVPAVQDGSVIQVADAATPTVLLSGKFHFGPVDNIHYYLSFYNADLNGDGRVDAADVLLVWAASLGQDVGTVNADVNGDGSVDEADVEIVTLIAVMASCGQNCDLDSDGDVSALDVQQVINSALSLRPHPEDSDVDGNGGVDAVDIQLVIGKALTQ